MKRDERQRLDDIAATIEAIRAHLQRGDFDDGLVFDARDRLAHRYFDTSHAILSATVQRDVPQLEAAVHRLMTRLG